MRIEQTSQIPREIPRKLDDSSAIKLTMEQRNDQIIKLNYEISDLLFKEGDSRVILQKQETVANLKAQNERDEEKLLRIEASSQQL